VTGRKVGTTAADAKMRNPRRVTSSMIAPLAGTPLALIDKNKA